MRHSLVAPSRVDIPPEWRQYIDEFIGFVREDADLQSVEPWKEEMVLEEMSKPIQKRRFLDYLKFPIQLIGRLSCDMILKTSDFVSPSSAPRVIYPMDATHLAETACITKAVKESFLKYTHWYTPGMDPAEVSQAVYDYVNTHGEIVESDLSKFDGTITPELRVFEALFYDALCPRTGNSVLREFRMVAKGMALEHPLDGSRASGSSFTTDGNTVITAFVDYVTHRQSDPPEISPREAYDKIGLHCGDDAIMSGNIEAIISVHTQAGLKIKAKKIPEGTPVSYLGRVFPNPWTSTTSLQDPARFWPKIAGVYHTGVNPKWVLCERANAFLLTDRRTPICSAYCRAILRVIGPQVKYVVKDGFRKWFEHNNTDLSIFNTYLQDPEDDAMLAAYENTVLHCDSNTKACADIDSIQDEEGLNSVEFCSMDFLDEEDNPATQSFLRPHMPVQPLVIPSTEPYIVPGRKEHPAIPPERSVKLSMPPPRARRRSKPVAKETVVGPHSSPGKKPGPPDSSKISKDGRESATRDRKHKPEQSTPKKSAPPKART